MSNIDDFLAHYGVKGMKWGVRKRGRSSTPTAKKAFLTKENVGKRAAQAAGALFVGKYIYNVGKIAVPLLLASEINRRQAAAGAKFAADLFSDARGIPNYTTIVR